MRILPISALACWVYCPRQFHYSYVLGEKPVLNRAMALGIAKHKVHELWPESEKRAVFAQDVQSAIESEVERVAGICVRLNSRALKKTGVHFKEAFDQVRDVARACAISSFERMAPLLKSGLRGEALWQALTPKIKPEYRIESKRLGVRGRIDSLECYENKIVPVELKSGSAPPDGVFDHHRVQVACYALVLEEIFGSRVDEAVVHYVDKRSRRPVIMNPFTREFVEGVARDVRKALLATQAPKGCGRDSCSACCKD
ncbi:Dna2/Cas4 domain-containing protein [Candidatus Woesearchaeota archaeon]|nr:MAG: Dna2/Cas4 domain-containing protein [Candidatus Woesearchaeota archaeon]